MTEDFDDTDTVKALLQMAGVTPTETELTFLVSGYATTRSLVRSLYAMPGVRYAEPAVTFDARA